MISIEDLRKEQKTLEERLTKINTAIRAFQEVCNHVWEDDGHDSHYNWEKCKICGESTRS